MNTHSDEQAVEAFVRETISHALNLPCREAVVYLRGLLSIADADPALDPVRKAYVHFHQSEQQLELIAEGGSH